MSIISRSNGGSDSFRTELLSPAAQSVVDHSMSLGSTWKLNTSDFHLPQHRSYDHHSFNFLHLLRAFSNTSSLPFSNTTCILINILCLVEYEI
uniref:Uncharacterized protein n=1 Tax=Solanum lycopersicum TaxID=4081 RepID=A0A3Q7J549_SOLLC